LQGRSVQGYDAAAIEQFIATTQGSPLELEIVRGLSIAYDATGFTVHHTVDGEQDGGSVLALSAEEWNQLCAVPLSTPLNASKGTTETATMAVTQQLGPPGIPLLYVHGTGNPLIDGKTATLERRAEVPGLWLVTVEQGGLGSSREVVPEGCLYADDQWFHTYVDGCCKSMKKGALRELRGAMGRLLTGGSVVGAMLRRWYRAAASVPHAGERRSAYAGGEGGRSVLPSAESVDKGDASSSIRGLRTLRWAMLHLRAAGERLLADLLRQWYRSAYGDMVADILADTEDVIGMHLSSAGKSEDDSEEGVRRVANAEGQIAVLQQQLRQADLKCKRLVMMEAQKMSVAMNQLTETIRTQKIELRRERQELSKAKLDAMQSGGARAGIQMRLWDVPERPEWNGKLVNIKEMADSYSVVLGPASCESHVMMKSWSVTLCEDSPTGRDGSPPEVHVIQEENLMPAGDIHFEESKKARLTQQLKKGCVLALEMAMRRHAKSQTSALVQVWRRSTIQAHVALATSVLESEIDAEEMARLSVGKEVERLRSSLHASTEQNVLLEGLNATLTNQREDAMERGNEYSRKLQQAKDAMENAIQAKMDAEAIASRYKAVAERTHQAVVEKGASFQEDAAGLASAAGSAALMGEGDGEGAAEAVRPAGRQRVSLESRQVARLENYRVNEPRQGNPLLATADKRRDRWRNTSSLAGPHGAQTRTTSPPKMDPSATRAHLDVVKKAEKALREAKADGDAAQVEEAKHHLRKVQRTLLRPAN